tara:strand:+ start:6919 stop:7686 length:768 start_codon:yes stop_codon:yes gene_type:complete
MIKNNNYAMICEYEGTKYNGFQSQITHNTIQDKIEHSINKIVNSSISIEYAGRTDSGVHAKHQVISVKLKWNHDPIKLQNAINNYLPKDIRVKNIKIAPQYFHPRKSAISRSYEYSILRSDDSDVFTRNTALQFSEDLNLYYIKKCLTLLKGQHNFRNFCKEDSIPENPIRILYDTSMIKEKNILKLKFKGSSFLRHQVRFMVGTILKIGTQKTPIKILKMMLESKNSSNFFIKYNVPPRGLCLTLVEYDGFSLN